MSREQRSERGVGESEPQTTSVNARYVFLNSRMPRSAQGPSILYIMRYVTSNSWKDLAALPGNRFEKGDRKGQYNIRINDQSRICFEWPDKSPGPMNVEIVDYH